MRVEETKIVGNYRKVAADIQDHERSRAIAKANKWLAREAVRLDMTPEEILSAIRRGWFPDQVERVDSKYALRGISDDRAPLAK